MTRQEIISDLRLKNPLLSIGDGTYGPGSTPYEAEIATRADRLEAATAPPPVDPLVAMSEPFFALVPVQYHADFAVPFATVRTLVMSGATGTALARTYLEQLPLPPDLEDARAPILALLPPLPAA